jgi:putative hydrolase of the HAD superfamily
MRYRAVIFDLFGTLVDNFSITEYSRVLAEMSAILGAPPEKFSRLWRDTFPMRTNGTHKTHVESIEHVCQELGVPVTAEQVRRTAEMRLEYTARSLVPRPDAVPTLRKLREDGFKVGLISDCSPETPAVWHRTPFVGLFDVTIFSCVAGMKKPDPRIYRLAASRLGMMARDCLYIGDGSSHELTGARAVGMYPVMIRDPGESVDTHYVEREDAWDGPVIAFLRQVLDLVK